VSEAAEHPDDLALRVLPVLAAGLIRALGKSARMHHHGDAALRAREASGQPLIMAFWHRHLLIMPYSYRRHRISVLSSKSWDGELMARTLERLGIDTSRGSTSRGGLVALRALLRKAEQGWDLAFTPDGPRGPSGVVKPGVIAAAAASGAPIFPVAMAASRCRRMRSWDRFVVPLPFSAVHFVYGETLTVGRRDDLEEPARELERRLHAAEAEAERLVGRTPDAHLGSESKERA